MGFIYGCGILGSAKSAVVAYVGTPVRMFDDVYNNN